MATAFSSPDQIVQVDPGVDNAQPNLDLEQLEEVFEIERCQTWVNENGYSRWGIAFLEITSWRNVNYYIFNLVVKRIFVKHQIFVTVRTRCMVI